MTSFNDTGSNVEVLPLIAFIVASAFAGQTARPDVTVSAGMTKEELQISGTFDMKLATARQMVRTDPKTAIDQLLALMAQADQYSFLAHHRLTLLEQLGHAYLAAEAPQKAVGYYRQRLALVAEDCGPESTYPAGCGVARMDLGVAQIIAGEQDGFDILKQAVDDHRRQVKLDGKPVELSHLVHLRHLSETALVLATACVRAGKTADARAALAESDSAAVAILAVPDAQQSLREDANRFLVVIKKLQIALDRK